MTPISTTIPLRLCAHFTDALRKNLDRLKMRGMSVRLDLVSLDELRELNDRFAFTSRSMGLKDHELDKAIASTLTPALRAIEQHRQSELDRRANVRLVE